MTPPDPYIAFLRAKAVQAAPLGPVCGPVHPALKPHQAAIAEWAVRGGRRAIFAAFGLGKSIIQMETLRQVLAAAEPGSPESPKALIVAPLGVRQEFVRDGRDLLGLTIRFIRRIEEATGADLYLTNYETIRDGKLDPNAFAAVSLDEASCLRGFGGTKTFREFMRLFECVRYKFVATATPSPNEYIELLAYSAFLGVMDVGQAKTRFFRRDSEHADNLTLHPHKEREFWLWVASWACFVQRPSDLGFSDDGYALPPLEVRWRELPIKVGATGPDKWGQTPLIAGGAKLGLVGAAKAKRSTLDARVAEAAAIVAAEPDEHFLLWHDLEAERRALEAALPGSRSVFGAQDLDLREQAIIDFSDGKYRLLNAKPVIAGSGCNFQRHCRRAIYVGIGFKFNDLIQSLHRIQRFGQSKPVIIDVIYAESEREVLRVLQAKWRRHEEMMAEMSEIIREYGLNRLDMAAELQRAIGVKERIEVEGDGYRLVNNDCVLEARALPENSVDLIVTSIPFSTQYEYTPSYNDFGHTDDNDHFWAQMDFLTPELLRALKPGRNAVIHVKDRIVPGGMTGLGFQTVYPFSDECIRHFVKHGFAFLARKTNVTDVVRENNQTYRLGWSEQCKDGTRMGAGMPEYILIFRKPPTDASDGYADRPVKKDKKSYTRARWQLDAAGFCRSSGDRPVRPEEFVGFDPQNVYRTWRAWNLTEVYDYAHHVRIGERLEAKGQLPPTFMLLPPHSWSDDVWTDVAQMRSLNTVQAQQGAEKHLCPLPFDIVRRAIVQMSEPGETVLDPFGGLMTTPYVAIQEGRRGIGFELNARYFLDGCRHVEAAARERKTPSLFDYLGLREPPDELEAAA